MKVIEGLEQYKDERGVIENLLPDGVTIHSAMLITGKKGAVRGNHYHKHDSHYCIVLSGILKYQFRDPKEKKKHSIILKRGDIIYTPPIERHAFVFMAKGAFLAFATEPRTQKNYEEDTIREKP